MTVTSTTRSVNYTGNNVATEFDYNFKIYRRDHVRVRILTTATGVVEEISDSHYSITGVGYTGSGGTVTYPLVGAPLPPEKKIIIERLVPYSQEQAINNQAGYRPETVERSLDLMMMAIQQLSDGYTERALRVPSYEIAVADIPNSIERAGKFLGFDDAGAPIAIIADPSGVTKASIGLGNVDNTADEDKPVSTPQQAALDALQLAVNTKAARADMPVSVKQYGAIGNDAADDNAAFATALAVSGSPQLYVPDGIYRVGADKAQQRKRYVGPGIWRILGNLVPAGDLRSTLTIPVGPSGVFPTLRIASEYLHDRRIDRGITVTLQRENDTNILLESLYWTHPDGESVNIIGNPANKFSVQFLIDRAVEEEFIKLDNGGRIGLINHMVIRSNDWISPGVWTEEKSYGILNTNGAVTLGGNLLIQKCYYGVKTENTGSFTELLSGGRIEDAGDVGIHFFNGASGVVTGWTVAGVKDITDNLGYGILTELGASARFYSMTMEYCNKAGAGNIGGSQWLHGGTITLPDQFGALNYGGRQELKNVIIDRAGINAIHAEGNGAQTEVQGVEWRNPKYWGAEAVKQAQIRGTTATSKVDTNGAQGGTTSLGACRADRLSQVDITTITRTGSNLVLAGTRSPASNPGNDGSYIYANFV